MVTYIGDLMTLSETNRKILDSGLYLFSSKGYRSTTTREIAEKAGINELTLFRNFHTKEKLLEEVIDYGFDIEGLQDSIQLELTGKVEEDLLRFMINVRGLVRSRDKVFAIMLREISSNDIIKRKMNQFPILMKSFMLGKLKLILGKNARDDIDMETAGIFLSSYYLRSEMMKIMMGEDPFHEVDERRLKEVVSIFLHGYLKEEAA